MQSREGRVQMAVSDEVMELVRILDDTGFGVLAGELLSEISLGGVEGDDGDAGDGGSVLGKPATSDAARPMARIPIPETEQISEAVRILRLRLVQPARALAEAERIAGALSGRPPVRIRFSDPEGARSEDRARSPGEFEAAPGDAQFAEALDNLLGAIERDVRASEL